MQVYITDYLAVGFNQALDIAIDDLGIDKRTLLWQVDSVRYCTTLGTTVLNERKGPRLGLFTTERFASTVPCSPGSRSRPGRGTLFNIAPPAVRRIDAP